ncbi:hypothetical protein [Pseudomonas sp. TH06]|uniref:hypothetical protein n=1 Tax=Pseudomonas sp. TH06 TaxID=2796372 RepID=UPI001F5B622B|nr:hypothetical protein [Pseudomonas sp. TH06]
MQSVDCEQAVNVQVSYRPLTRKTAARLDMYIAFDASLVEKLADADSTTLDAAKVGQCAVAIYQHAFREVSLAAQCPVSTQEMQSIEIMGVFDRSAISGVEYQVVFSPVTVQAATEAGTVFENDEIVESSALESTFGRVEGDWNGVYMSGKIFELLKSRFIWRAFRQLRDFHDWR